MAKISLGDFGFRTPFPVTIDTPNVGEAVSEAGGRLADASADVILRTQAEMADKRRTALKVEALSTEATTLNELASTRAGILKGLNEGTIHKDDAYNQWKELAPKLILDKLQGVDRENRELLKASLSGQAGNMGLDILSAVDIRNQQDIGAGLEGYLGGLLRYAPNDMEYAIRSGQGAIDSMGPASGLNAEQVAEHKRLFTERAALTALNDFVVLNRNDPEALGKAFEGARNSAYLSPEARIQALATIQTYAEGAERRLEAQARAFEAEQQKQRDILGSDLEIAVRRGQAGYREIEQGLQSKVITPAKRTELVTYLDNRLKEQADKAAKQREQIAQVQAALSGTGFLDFRKDADKDAVDAYYEAVVVPSLQKMKPLEAAAQVADYSGRTGIIPRVVREQIRGALRAGNPEMKAQAADLLDRLKISNPSVIDDFAQSDIAMGNAIAIYTAAGVPAAQAVKMAEEAVAVPEPEKQAREVRYRQEKASKGNLKLLQNELATGFNLFEPSMPKVVPDKLVGEFETIVNSEFLRNGDLEVARKTALERIKGVWGVTGIGGKRWMEYAPETVYKVPGADPEWIAEQLYDELSRDALWDGKPDLLLQSDSVTARESRPSYVVLTRKDGELNPVLGKDGKPIRFRPDYQSSPAARKRSQEAVKSAPASNEGYSGSVSAPTEAPQYGQPKDSGKVSADAAYEDYKKASAEFMKLSDEYQTILTKMRDPDVTASAKRYEEMKREADALEKKVDEAKKRADEAYQRAQ